MGFEHMGGREVWRGRIAAVRVDEFRHDDGDVVRREVVQHPGAAVMLPFDGDQIWLVRQPREVVREEGLLELPAGKLDAEGEDPLEVAKRELREEIGKSAGSWQYLTSFYSSPGFTTELTHAFLAADLSDDPADSEENERIEIVRHPVARLDDLIRSCRDSKTLLTLLWFRAFVL